MLIEVTQPSGATEIQIDYEACTNCGICADLCKGDLLHMVNDTLILEQTENSSCSNCGECMALCPENAIQVNGAAADLYSLKDNRRKPDYDDLLSLLQSRHNITNFTPRAIADEILQHILMAAKTAPLGLPPSDIGVNVFRTQNTVQTFRQNLLAAFSPMRKLLSIPQVLFRKLYKFGATNTLNRKNILRELNRVFEKDAADEDWILYNAPAALHFYSVNTANSSETALAAGYAILAAESLDIGSGVSPLAGLLLDNVQSLKEKYDIPKESKHSLVILLGYPEYKPTRGIEHQFTNVQYFD
ncbi:MAG: hypothetical protein GF372_05145 [Candidatus Marinimicrobia bacterium]|nr:hypothetical protein [Candidatus Neomarinimicrobiota bacterium]